MELGALMAGLRADRSGRPLIRVVGAARGDEGRAQVVGITDDSRAVGEGFLFVARAGSAVDGATFVPDAVRAGASVVLADEGSAARVAASVAPGVVVLASHEVPLATAELAEAFHGRPSGRLDLIGVTGTNGKTTIAHLVHQLVNASGVRCGLIGTVVVDDGRSVRRSRLTTPGAVELSGTLRAMVEAGCGAAVMETSSHALDQDRVAALRYGVGVFTNLTGDHLDYHGTMERYAAAKARLFEMLPVDGWAVVNAQDAWAGRMLRDCRSSVLACSVVEGGLSGVGMELPGGAGRAERAWAVVRGSTMHGMELELFGPWGAVSTRVGLIGRHNAMNALQALGAAWCIGRPPRELWEGLASASAPPGRLEPVTSAGDPLAVLVDYAHTDDALRQVLGTLRAVVPPGGRLVVVFGCGGDRDATKRPRMGAVASELADVVWVTSDNPRREPPGAIIESILAGVPEGALGRVNVEADRSAAIAGAIGSAREGDVVLIAGKGHETEQIVGDGRGGTVSMPFDDREVARRALAGLGLGRGR